MSTRPTPHSIGTKVEDIDVRLSYKIVELFSEGLYTSPNKAIEELVTNSFDAGATNVHVLIPPNPASANPGDAIVVTDDGEGMGIEGLKQHWIIGTITPRQSSFPRHLKVYRSRVFRPGMSELDRVIRSEKDPKARERLMAVRCAN